jgi:hypothetical protein
MLMLPMELDIGALSGGGMCDHSELCALPRESEKVAEPKGLKMPFRVGMVMPREPMVGEESGEDCSARVEWCRLVHALEKSKPRDRRGRTEEREAYEAEESSFGESGIRLVKLAMLVLLIFLGGICRLSPREGASDFLDVTGLGATLISSFDLLNGSTKRGEGKSVDLISWEDFGLGLAARARL